MAELERMRIKLDEIHAQDSRRKYGDILDLLSIEVQSEAINIISQFWDNQMRCFVLPHFHLCLVLEEYAGIMRQPVNEDSTVYTYSGRLPSQVNIAQLLGLPREKVEFTKQGESETIPLDFLVRYMTTLSERGDWLLFSRVLALAIYGIVLFPAATNSVDLAAVSVFMAVEYQGVNPVPAILADTYLTLSCCQKRRKGKLKCCLQLLTVWLANHLFGKRWSNGVRLDVIHHPLRDFAKKD